MFALTSVANVRSTDIVCLTMDAWEVEQLRRSVAMLPESRTEGNELGRLQVVEVSHDLL
jgi:hypothetical protein